MKDATPSAADVPLRMVPFSRQGIARRAQGLLPSGAVIRHIVCGQAFAPWWQMIPLLNDFYVWPWHGFRIIAITDDAMYLLSATHWWRWNPKALVKILPRGFEFSPHFGATFTRVELGHDRLWIPLSFKGDMAAADDDLRAGIAGGATPPAEGPDPLLAERVRWRRLPGQRRRYVADVDDGRWELDIDDSNAGVRYIIKEAGRYAREIDHLPGGWALDDGDGSAR